MDCIFCQIVSGSIPAEKVFETEHFLAILDIHPIAPGHTLVYPREHHETLLDLPPDQVGELFASVQKVGREVVRTQGAEGWNMFVNNHKCAGQAIPHVHVHVIPRKTGDGVRFHWDPKPCKDGELTTIAEAIRTSLASAGVEK